MKRENLLRFFKEQRDLQGQLLLNCLSFKENGDLYYNITLKQGGLVERIIGLLEASIKVDLSDSFDRDSYAVKMSTIHTTDRELKKTIDTYRTQYSEQQLFPANLQTLALLPHDLNMTDHQDDLLSLPLEEGSLAPFFTDFLDVKSESIDSIDSALFSFESPTIESQQVSPISACSLSATKSKGDLSAPPQQRKKRNIELSEEEKEEKKLKSLTATRFYRQKKAQIIPNLKNELEILQDREILSQATIHFFTKRNEQLRQEIVILEKYLNLSVERP